MLKVRVTTWDKGSYELFDGEADQYKQNSFDVLTSGVLLRNNNDNEAYYLDQMKMKSAAYKSLLEIRRLDGKYYIPKQEDLWQQLLGRENIDQAEAYQLKRNDVLKLGKKQLKILSICGSEMSHYENFGSFLEGNFDSAVINVCQFQFYIAKYQEDEVKKSCRICLSSSYQTNNPLISVCNCSGSTKYIHYECLKRWLDGKMQIKEYPNYVEINSKSVKCEICLTFYPPSVSFSGQKLVLYDINAQNHVVIEDLDGVILVINFNNIQSLTLGRGHDSDIKISEITISRTHVKLQLIDKKLYIQDKQSKFGTLIKIQTQKEIIPNETMYLQSGRSRITIRHTGNRNQNTWVGCPCI